jgi:LysM repeat protein
MNRAVGFSMVFLACLPLSAGCSSERLASSLLETTTARAQADALVHDTQGELAALHRDRMPQQSLIRVHPSDSLWKLAHEHAMIIDELKRVNGLTTDVIHAGQRLMLPSPTYTNISTWV